MKRWSALICLLLAASLLCGCGQLLEGEYESVRRHVSGEQPGAESVPLIRVSTYEEIYDALVTMIQNADEFGVIRVSSYDGNVEADVNRACMEVSNDSPLGAWAVYYISCTVNRIIAYYDAEISITYKRTPLEIQSVVDVSSSAALEGELRYLMGSYSSGEAIRLPAIILQSRDVAEWVAEIYYGDPTVASVRPEVIATVYPETGRTRILDLQFQYPYTVARLTNMQTMAESAAQEIADRSRGTGEDGEALLRACWELADTVEFNGERELSGETGWDRSCTAFGALIDGKATSEGFAMALELICRELDLQCRVVRGRRDSVDHCWNLVRLGEDWYHVDASAFVEDGAAQAFLRRDGEMARRYWWDVNAYEVCEGPLSYAYFVPGAPAEIGETGETGTGTEPTGEPTDPGAEPTATPDDAGGDETVS